MISSFCLESRAVITAEAATAQIALPPYLSHPEAQSRVATLGGHSHICHKHFLLYTASRDSVEDAMKSREPVSITTGQQTVIDD